jgi:hypothetical protein
MACDAALDHELAVHLHLGKDLLNPHRKVLPVFLGVLLLDRHPGAAEVLVEGEGEQGEEEAANDKESPA